CMLGIPSCTFLWLVSLAEWPTNAAVSRVDGPSCEAPTVSIACAAPALPRAMTHITELIPAGAFERRPESTKPAVADRCTGRPRPAESLATELLYDAS